MVLILHIRFLDMSICAIILMSSLPAAWIAIGCVMVALLLMLLVLYLLKWRQVAILKKEVWELRDTIRMMRYEETSLSRMLHKASEQSAPVVEVDNEDGRLTSPMAVPETNEAMETMAAELAEQQCEQAEQQDIPQSCKQPINERRPAISNDLFAAWFAENEDCSPEGREPEGEEQAEPVAEEEKPREDSLHEDDSKAPESSADAVGMPVPASVDESPIEEAAQQGGTDAVSSEKGEPSDVSKDDERFCRKLERIVHTRMRNPNLNIDIIAAQFGIGRTNFYRKVRELTGMSPNDFLRKCRMERAAELLSSTEVAVSEVCAQVGIPDAQYFSRVFKAHFGVSPSAYRESNNQ